jgi:branched-subunit amino acid transport protein
LTDIWLAIAVAAVVNVVIKAAGPLLVGDRRLPSWAPGVIALLAPALLAALVVVEVFGPRWSALNVPIVGGLAATALAKLLRAPVLLAVVVGVAVTAVLRLIIG